MSARRPDPKPSVREIDPPADAQERLDRALLSLASDIFERRMAERRPHPPRFSAPR